jgi:hypothetical protein
MRPQRLLYAVSACPVKTTHAFPRSQPLAVGGVVWRKGGPGARRTGGEGRPNLGDAFTDIKTSGTASKVDPSRPARRLPELEPLRRSHTAAARWTQDFTLQSMDIFTFQLDTTTEWHTAHGSRGSLCQSDLLGLRWNSIIVYPPLLQQSWSNPSRFPRVVPLAHKPTKETLHETGTIPSREGQLSVLFRTPFRAGSCTESSDRLLAQKQRLPCSSWEAWRPDRPVGTVAVLLAPFSIRHGRFWTKHSAWEGCHCLNFTCYGDTTV